MRNVFHLTRKSLRVYLFSKNFISVRVDFAIFISHYSLQMTILVRFPNVIKLQFF